MSESRIKAIISSVVGDNVCVHQSRARENLSPFLAGSFDFYDAMIFGLTFCILKPTDVQREVQATVKQAAVVERDLAVPTVVFFEELSSGERAYLIAHKRGFICANGDTFIPELFMRLKPLPIAASKDTFAPAERSVFLYCLNHAGSELSQARAAKALGMSPASVSRGFSSLVKRGMLDFVVGGKTGRKRTYLIEDPREFFRRGRERFGDVVRRRLTIMLPENPGLLRCGLDALAARSELNAPPLPTYAVSPAHGRELAARQGSSEYGAVLSEVLVLSYDPVPFSDGGLVDRFTMLATISEQDERIMIAIRQAMEGVAWYEE